MKKRTIIYVDGFNLYYRLLKNRPDLKWLNLKSLAYELLPDNHDIVRINYYTARLSARAHDPDAPARQATYLKALGTVPEIVIHRGNFMVTEPWMPLAKPPQAKPNGYNWQLPLPDVVKVQKSEEKGSDVNLAVHLVKDAFQNAFDVAAVITNDTDLVEAIRIVVKEVGKPVGLLVPVKSPSESLKLVSTFQRHISSNHLLKSQFPDEIEMPDGTKLPKPRTWVAN